MDNAAVNKRIRKKLPAGKSVNLCLADKKTNVLAERIKELNCLYSISNFLENQDATLNWILTHAVDLIPAALQYPDSACACIRLDGHKYVSANFQRTHWCPNTPIMLNGKHVGDLDVFYTEAMSSDESGLFLEQGSLAETF